MTFKAMRWYGDRQRVDQRVADEVETARRATPPSASGAPHPKLVVKKAGESIGHELADLLRHGLG